MAESPEFPIICLWVHPRSMSTAVERIMRERGDLECFHEPFMYDYYVHRRQAYMPHFDVDPSQPIKYQHIKEMLLDKAQFSPVFIKDMSYYMIPQLFDDKEFAQRITHSFLIRNPMHSILSYFKLDQNVTLEEIGLEALWRHANWLQQELSITPIVLVAEQIRQDSRGVISNYWQQLGLDNKDKAFEWNSEKTPEDWQQVSGWHGNVSQSKGIREVSKENDLKRQQEFDELAEQYPKLRELLEHHLPYYEKLKSLATS